MVLPRLDCQVQDSYLCFPQIPHHPPKLRIRSPLKLPHLYRHRILLPVHQPDLARLKHNLLPLELEPGHLFTLIINVLHPSLQLRVEPVLRLRPQVQLRVGVAVLQQEHVRIRYARHAELACRDQLRQLPPRIHCKDIPASSILLREKHCPDMLDSNPRPVDSSIMYGQMFLGYLIALHRTR